MRLNQMCLAEARIATGNGEQTMSRDVYRLGHRVDFFRMCSVYHTTMDLMSIHFNVLLSFCKLLCSLYCSNVVNVGLTKR